MTQENKELLLKDLLGRVLYGVKVDYHSNIFTLGYNLYLNNSNVAFENYPMLYFLENIESVKPYLRPMSSMTKEEKNVFYQLVMKFNEYELFYYNLQNRNFYDYLFRYTSELLDWLNAHHFDYRGLIPRGLALEAPKDMYNI